MSGSAMCGYTPHVPNFRTFGHRKPGKRKSSVTYFVSADKLPDKEYPNKCRPWYFCHFKYEQSLRQKKKTWPRKKCSQVRQKQKMFTISLCCTSTTWRYSNNKRPILWTMQNYELLSNVRRLEKYCMRGAFGEKNVSYWCMVCSHCIKIATVG